MKGLYAGFGSTILREVFFSFGALSCFIVCTIFNFYYIFIFVSKNKVPFDMIEFALYEHLKYLYIKDRGQSPVGWPAAVLGAIAGAIAAGLTTPIGFYFLFLFLAISFFILFFFKMNFCFRNIFKIFCSF